MTGAFVLAGTSELPAGGEARSHREHRRHAVEADEDRGEDEEQPHRREPAGVGDVHPDEVRDHLDGQAGGEREAENGAADSGDHALRRFRVGVDEEDWLSLNGRAFASHPEQGRVSRADLDALLDEPWFDAGDFLLLHDGGRLAGFCWLKVDGSEGEFYVVGVDPDHQGEGLGRKLAVAGLDRLRERGIRSAHLYVEGDNLAAVRLYRSLGFADDSVDIQYRSAAR